MSNYEKLHLANNLDALDLIAKKNCNAKKMKFQLICTGLNKLYKESQQNVLDQEKTYILLYRYLDLYKQLLNTQNDKQFVELRYGSEYEKVQTQYQKTKSHLQDRYGFQNRQAPKEAAAKDESPGDSTPNKIFKGMFISCQELFRALEKSYNILLVDARPDYDFRESRINRGNVINVPDQCIASGLSAHKLGQELPLETQEIWDKRDSFDVIVLFDWNTTPESFALTKLQRLRSSIVDWDSNRKYREPPVVLSGGYLELLQTYPTLCINPQVYLQKQNNELDELLDIDNVVYPTEADNSTVMGLAEDSAEEDAPRSDDPVLKESLCKENKELAQDRQEVIAKLLNEEHEWKRLNDLCSNEKNLARLAQMKEKEVEVQQEIAKLETALLELNTKKNDVKRKLEHLNYDPKEDRVITPEIMQSEEDESEKMRIINAIAEERCTALKKARALKPRSEEQESPVRRVIDAPVINRATKPGPQSQIVRIFAEPIGFAGPTTIALKNIRNTCYMNTIIQCMSHLPPIRHLFCNGVFTKYQLRAPAAIIFETAWVIRSLWSKNQRLLEPTEFYDKCGALEPTYKLGHHEDCMEFFLFLLNHLTEDSSYEMRRPKVMTPKQKAWYNQFQGKQSIFIDLFYHQIRIEQHCQSCNLRTFKFEIESTFMLSVPDTQFILKDLIDEYMAEYIIDEYCCSKCKQPVTNRKEIYYAPKVVVIILKRYRQFVDKGVMELRKIETKCHFTKNEFRIGSGVYKLSAIAMHSGNLNYGHYAAVGLTQKGWYEFNDEIVRPININDDSIKEKACAFFYTMCD